ncbi:MAG: hypothetical protein J0I43_07560 [Microbacterium sp.]|uniref:hypothetical protein n=1 Tax=Microbacterium sp. TaxID=51671 RepID=UPI001AC629E3|nr:hypothetical protein [Microbacterium sp.]MBN9177208.1 hypothetical protein [Microbacterium sp.]
MRIPSLPTALTVLLVAVSLTACTPLLSDRSLDESTGTALDRLMVTVSEAPGWTVTADHGDVGGESSDCTGAPFAWPDTTIVAHASQFLDREGESVAVVLKRFDGAAAPSVDAVRRSVAPCALGQLPRRNGSMIEAIGEDSFAYQAAGTDDAGSWVMSNMVAACGDLLLETITMSSTNQLDQAELESLVSGVAERMSADQGCD